MKILYQTLTEPMLEPLIFPSKNESVIADLSLPLCPSSISTRCVLCEEEFKLYEQQNDFLKHLLLKHKLVIGDIKIVVNLVAYIGYWRDKLNDDNLRTYCTVIKTNSAVTDKGVEEKYFLLCDALPEDKQLREHLQKQRLEYILQCQQQEREDTNFSRICLFCKTFFHGNRSVLLDHMVVDHNFSIGRPDNIVFTNQLLDTIEDKLNKFECLLCEKLFKDRTVLKEHMRKKIHRKLNPKNPDYDKFYIINYLELGKNWEDVQSEVDDDDELRAVGFNADSDADSWDDWKSNDDIGSFCLFCKYSTSDIDDLQAHLLNKHKFDLMQIKEKMNLDFYLKVKLINYIRRQVHQRRCINCDEKFDDTSSLMIHMTVTAHINQLPDKSIWDQSQYLFPTYENDNLLHSIEDKDDEKSFDTTKMIPVIPEDDKITPNESILIDDNLRSNLF